jgi:GNAT superfamily N-acetyltransferase
VTATTIRRAGPEHTVAIHGLLRDQLAAHRVAIADADLATAIDGVLAVPRRGFFLVAEQAGAPVGIAYVSFIWALEHGGQAAWLEELYVAPSHREGGIGSRLLEAVIAAARAAGCAAIDLEIDADHERVRSLYARHGFTALPRGRVVKRLGPP